MNQHWSEVLLGLALFASAASAQTTVTTSGGTTNTVPVFTGSATVGNSVITQSGGNVGIGTTSPATLLNVAGDIGIQGYLRTTSGSNTNLNYIELYDGNAGMDFFTLYGVGHPNQGYFNFYTASSTSPTLNINSNGSVGVGTATPNSRLTVSGNGVWGAADITLNNTGTGGQPWTIFSTNGSFTQGAGGLLFYRDNSDGTSGTLMLSNSGSVGIGTTAPGAKLEVDGNVKLTSGSGASITFADGTVQSTAYTGVTCGGDYAESVDVTGDRTNYSPGDVMVIDPDSPGRFLKSNESYSTAVTGVYSTKPGVLGRRQTTDPRTTTTEIPMAMVGIVPTKVSAENGPIQPGDLLVSSSSIGFAMKGTDRSRMLGAVIGKALGRLDSGIGVIEVAITLQ